MNRWLFETDDSYVDEEETTLAAVREERKELEEEEEKEFESEDESSEEYLGPAIQYQLRVVVASSFVDPGLPDYSSTYYYQIENLLDRYNKLNPNVPLPTKPPNTSDREFVELMRMECMTLEEMVNIKEESKTVIFVQPRRGPFIQQPSTVKGLPWKPAVSRFGYTNFHSKYMFDLGPYEFSRDNRQTIQDISVEVHDLSKTPQRFNTDETLWERIKLSIGLSSNAVTNRYTTSRLARVIIDKVPGEEEPTQGLEAWIKSWIEGTGEAHTHFYLPLISETKRREEPQRKKDDDDEFSESDEEYDEYASFLKKEVQDTKTKLKKSHATPPVFLNPREDGSSEGWINIHLFLFRVDDGKQLPEGEWPVLPKVGANVQIDNHRIVRILLDRFKKSAMRSEIIDYALKNCNAAIFEEVLAICLEKSDDPLLVALKASQICMEREEEENTGGESWSEKSEACIEVAKNFVSIIPSLQSKPHDTQYYDAAAQNIIDESLAYAVENEVKDLCGSTVVARRAGQRWKKHTLQFLPFTTLRLSPIQSFTMQAFFFLVFCCLLTFNSSTLTVMDFTWKTSLDSQIFGDPEEDTNNFWHIEDIDTFYSWLTDDLVPVCFTKSGYTEETQYFLLSTPSIILRQIRVKPEHCPFVSDKIGNQTCYPNLLEPGNYHYEDIESTYKGYPYYPDLGGSYVSGLDTTHYTYYGKGGYTVFLNGTIDNVTAQIDELRNVSFIDEGTRAVILEFGLYSPNANRYMLFEILVEFTHIPSIHQQRHMIVLQPLLNDDNEVIINYLLILFAVGYSIQELAEIIVACGSILEEEREKRIKKLEEQLDTGGSTSSLYGGSSIFWKTIKTGTLQHLGEVWNVIDILVNANVTIYVSLSLYQTYLMPSSPFNVSMSTFWEIYNKQAIAAIFGSLGLVATWFRLLYFLLLIPVVGPLVIGMLRMYRDVLYFLFLLIVFICGFTAAFDIVFAGKIMEYSGYKTSFYTTLRMSLGDVTYTDSKTLFPNLPLTLFGLSLIVIYVLICVILLVNLLIAMMGGTFDDLRESIQQKWHHLSQELLLHYERFVLLPPPFNFVHFLIFPLFTSVPIFCVSDQNWRLTGKWNPDQDWKNRQKLRLEKSAYQNRILSPYSTDRKKQYELEKIMTVIDSELNKAKKKIAADMRYELCRNNWNDSRNAGEFGKLFTSVDETLDRVTSSEDTIDETVDEIQDHLLGEEILAFAQDKEKEIEKELKEKQQKGQGTGPSSARGEVQPTENAPETGTLEMTGLDDYQLFFNDTDKNLIKEALTRPTNTQTPSPSYSEESE